MTMMSTKSHKMHDHGLSALGLRLVIVHITFATFNHMTQLNLGKVHSIYYAGQIFNYTQKHRIANIRLRLVFTHMVDMYY